MRAIQRLPEVQVLGLGRRTGKPIRCDNSNHDIGNSGKLAPVDMEFGRMQADGESEPGLSLIRAGKDQVRVFVFLPLV